MKYQKGMGSGALLALVVVVAIILIMMAFIAGRGMSAMDSAKSTLSTTAVEKDGRKELQEAVDKLEASLKLIESGEGEVECEQLRKEFDDLKSKVEQAKVKGGIGVGTAWAVDRALDSLKDEIDKMCE